MSEGSAAAGGMLLVTIDRLPAWIMPAYGSTWLAMPVVDALAGRGLTLDRLMAESDGAIATVATLLGRGPEGGDDWPLLAAAEAAGWRPVVVTDDQALAAALTGTTATRLVAPAAGDAAADEAATDLGRLFAAAADLASEPARRFLWCHATSLGTTWDAPTAYREAYLDPDDPPPPPGAGVPEMTVDERTDPDLIVGLRQLFAGQLTLLDDRLGRLLEAVADRDAGLPWTILFAGVRGMPLGLHGRIGPTPLAPFGELVHLPAILVDHAGRMAAQRYGGLLVPADLAATLREQLGGRPREHPDPRAGRSLTGLLDAWQHSDRDRVICVAERGTAIATPAWQLVLPRGDTEDEPAPLLYAKPDDYFEACDVADRSPEVAAELAELARLAGTDLAAAWAAPLAETAVTGG